VLQNVFHHRQTKMGLPFLNHYTSGGSKRLNRSWTALHTICSAAQRAGTTAYWDQSSEVGFGAPNPVFREFECVRHFYGLLENFEVFWVGHGLNLGNGGWKAILAWAERFGKSEW